MKTKPNKPTSENVNSTNDVLGITRFKVDGGYVYNSVDKSTGIMGSCFVPDLRPQLAGLALQGLCSNYDLFKKAVHFTGGKEEILICESAVQYAEALITELNKKQESK